MKILFNPFEKFQENQLLIFGIFGFFILSILAFIFNFRFNGLIDAHVVENVKWYQPFLDQIINVSLLSISLFLFGKKTNPKTRFIDITNTVLISKIPMIFILFSNINNYIFNISNELLKNINQPEHIKTNPNIIFLLVFGIITILIIMWSFIILWNGFKIATYAKKDSHLIGFIVIFAITYIISKIIFYYL